MNTSMLALLATVLIGLISIPLITPQFESSFTPTGAFIVGASESEFNSSDTPGSETTFYTPEKFRKEIKTAQGKFEFEITPDGIYQKLTRPDMIILVTKNNNENLWLLKTSDYILNISKTPFKEISYFSSSKGWIKTEVENGETTETWYGLNHTFLMEKYEEAKSILEEKVNEIENIAQGMVRAPTTNVLINEFMPDPSGSDATEKPEGEWIELYNPTNENINLSGWYLTDADEDHILEIVPYNTNTGETIVPANDFVVVYRNGDGDFSLNNNGDTIKLFDSYRRLVDSYTYSVYPGENKTIGRCPDGENNWQIFDEPTPGDENC